MKTLARRASFAVKACCWHFVCSTSIASLIALLIFLFWYPSPYWRIAGGEGLLLILFFVDVVCGPLLTLVLFSPEKPRRELCFDLSVIVSVQCIALVYGIYSLAQARPIALAYEVDRFRVITPADIYEREISLAPPWAKPFGLGSIQLVGVRRSQKGADLVESMNLSMAGIEPSQRPSRWQDYSLSSQEVLTYAQPISQLVKMHPTKTDDIASAAAETGLSENELKWLPLVARHASDWVILLDKNEGRPRAFLNLEGYFPLANKVGPD